MNKQLKSESATYTTNCECWDYDEETGTQTPAEYCREYCHEDNKDWCLELIDDWLLKNNNPQSVIVYGNGLTWQRLSGYKIVLAHDILNALMINGEFTISLTLEGKELTARRSSHDEPTGASFVIEPASY